MRSLKKMKWKFAHQHGQANWRPMQAWLYNTKPTQELSMLQTQAYDTAATLIALASNIRSIIFRSDRNIPAWCIPKPLSKSCFISLLRDSPMLLRKNAHWGCSSQLNSSIDPSVSAASFKPIAVLTVSFRACTKTITWCPWPTSSDTFSNVTRSRFLRDWTLPGLPLIPMKCCSRGIGRNEESK